MELLKELCCLNGVSGNESNVSDFVKDCFLPYSTNVSKDNMGNVIAKIDNNKDFTILIEAHLDEIGLIVTEIDENGFIKFTSLGGIDSTILPGKEVIIHGKKNLIGIIGAKPPHLMTEEEKDKKIEFDSLFIDAGYSKEDITSLVKVGDVISFDNDFLILKNNRFASKSIDNRFGIYVLLKVFEKLSKENLNFNLAAVAAVQEELGCIGAKTAVFDIKPDYAIVVDVTHGESKYIDKYKGFKLGNGATIAVGPNFSNSYNKKLLDYLKNNNIKHQIEVCEGHSGTDAWPIQVSSDGIPCSLISVPLRHMHSSVELCDYNDIQNSLDIICGFLKEVEVC